MASGHMLADLVAIIGKQYDDHIWSYHDSDVITRDNMTRDVITRGDVM